MGIYPTDPGGAPWFPSEGLVWDHCGPPVSMSRQPAAPSPMNEDLERIQKHHGGPGTDSARPQKPYWKRMHHSPFFWVAAFFILLAMTIFIMTDGFLLRPRGQAVAPAASSSAP
jgi:hypothetical protein